ncbi:MAG: MFS family permease [Urechidicola sp.]
MNRPSHILPIIIFSQFTGTSLWFAGNAIISDLQQSWTLPEQSLGYVTSSVQLGFIVGTLVFAYLALADRFSPRKVFFTCSTIGATMNAALLVAPEGMTTLLFLRFLTGFFLAGIYPVGMKIAASWYEKELGRALGYLVGALVMGTAFPHLIRSLGTEIPWQQVIAGVSLIAVFGGLLMLILVPDGPFLPKGSAFNASVLTLIFRSKKFRASTLGYFGHMWELYTLWAFIPLFLLGYATHSNQSMNISFWSFITIAVGFIGCAVGGLMSGKLGSVKVASIQLFISGVCCILSPFLFLAEWPVFILFMLVWGVTVIGDSPQFSTLTAQNAPREYVGSALTIVNSIGFLITVVSIQLTSNLLPVLGVQYIFWLLIPGPVLGLLALRSIREEV